MSAQAKGSDASLLGQGLYTVPDASRLARIPVDTVRRWVLGYSYRPAPTSRKLRGRASKPPVVVLSLPKVGDTVVLSFLELMELHLVRALKNEGVSLQRIRRAAEEAREIVGTPYPFASKPIFTDGRNIFMRLTVGPRLERLLQLGSGGQWVLEPVLREFLRQIDFDPSTKMAMKWWPRGHAGVVVIDPTVSFGAPVLAASGIRTSVLWEAAQAEPAQAVAKWYGIAPRVVSAAVEFEESLRAA